MRSLRKSGEIIVTSMSESAAQEPRRRGLSLQVSIATSFVALLVFICASITWYTYERNSRLVLQFADSFLDSASTSTIDNTVYLLEPVSAAVEELAVIGQFHENLLYKPEMLRHLLQVLRSYPHVYSAYIGFDENGRFIQAQRIPDNAATFGPNNSPVAPGSRFVLRTLDRKGAESVDSYRYISDWNAETGTEALRNVAYDPRKRPFYNGAKESDFSYLSDIYVFASNRKPGITISRAVRDLNNKFIGVVGADITLESMSAFLKRQKIGKHGIAFIVGDKGEVVAFPDAGRSVRQDGLTVALPTIKDLGEPYIVEAFERRKEGAGDRFSYRFNGVTYMASFQSFPRAFQKQWTIVILVPENDFVGDLKRTTQDIMMISAGVGLVAILAVAYLSRRITRPIRQVIGETKKIRELALEDDVKISSRITEIRELIDAMRAMKTTIHSFSRFVPRGLVQQLLASGKSMELGGQAQRLTIMFSDLASFSRLSERLPARNLMLLISQHFDMVTKIVLRNHGTIDKFIGDSVMAFWGAPLPQVEHASNACRSALLIQRQMDAMNETFEREGEPTLSARIGIHTDTVVVGNIGSSERMSYTAIGDGVNVASRLEGVNKAYGTRICVSEAVFRETGDLFVMRPVDHVAVKGRRGGITVYELMAAEDTSEIGASERQRDLAARTSKAFFAYMDRKWEKALRTYTNAAEAYPDDRVVAKFAERCRELLANPPDANWSGVMEMQEK